METKFINFEKLEVTGMSKTEALEKAPFFIQGEAGWGKTSIITGLAKSLGKTVITVYLDKAEATDLGGIPVPAKSKRGADYVKHLLPEWAKLIYDNPKTNFLLFFDEMNQAAPDVMNALMPIVLKTEICGIKFKQSFVGCRCKNIGNRCFSGT